MGTRNERSTDVVIIGGGIVGCALAWELTKAGVAVSLIDRREIAREASWASAGIISPPGPRHGSRATLALHSFLRYPSLIAEVEEFTGQSVGFVASGEIDLATEDTLPALRETLEWQQAHGLSVESIDSRAIREREPAVHHDYVHGIFAKDAGSLILSRMATALARAARLRGASIVEHTPVTGSCHGSEPRHRRPNLRWRRPCRDGCDCCGSLEPDVGSVDRRQHPNHTGEGADALDRGSTHTFAFGHRRRRWLPRPACRWNNRGWRD